MTVGVGFMVKVKVLATPEQPFRTGVTVIVAVCVVATLLDVKLILPVPDAAKPILVFEFVQLNVALALPVKFVEIV